MNERRWYRAVCVSAAMCVASSVTIYYRAQSTQIVPPFVASTSLPTRDLQPIALSPDDLARLSRSIPTRTAAMSQEHQSQAANPIPFDQLGAVAGKQYNGDGLSIVTTDEGVRLHSVFQKLDGDATREGLWITSTAEGARGRLRVVASAIGRDDQMTSLDATGEVSQSGEGVKFTRPEVVEEYSTAVEGVRQDFVLPGPPTGDGDLRLDLSLAGAQAETTAVSVRLTFVFKQRPIHAGVDWKELAERLFQQ